MEQTRQFFTVLILGTIMCGLSGCGGASFATLPQSGAANNNSTTNTGGTTTTNSGGSSGGTTVTLQTDQTLSQHYYLGLGVPIIGSDGLVDNNAYSECQANIAATLPYFVSANNDGVTINATCIFPDQTLAQEASEGEWLDYVVSAYLVYPMPGVIAGAGPIFTMIDSRSQTLAACQAEMALIGGGTPFTILPDYYLMTANNVTVTCPANSKGGYTLTVTVDTSKYEM